MYDDKDLQRLYGEKYFSHRTRPEMWNRRAEFVFEKFKPRTALDVGCASGEFVKSMVDIPILRKDFIISEYQVWESFHAGADAILLIADIMEMEMLKDLHDLACELGLHVLVETHNESHFRLFDEIKPSMIGFNCRDLQTMKTDINFFKKIMLDLPGQPVWVAESGISSFEDLKFVFELGFNAALVGTHLMGSDDPGVALSNLLRSA